MVEWTPIDTGYCRVRYTIQYENKTGVVGIITDIDDATHAWCTNLYSGATAIKMWAVYNGNIGAKSAKIPLQENSYNSATLSGD